MENEIKKSILQNQQDAKSFVEEIRSYLLAPRGPVKLSTQEYVEVMDGMKVIDITSPKQFEVGLTILLIECSKMLEFGDHFHENQSQLIYLIEGTVYDSQAKMTYIQGQAFFVPKANRHSIRYYPGTKAVLSYMPKLGIV